MMNLLTWKAVWSRGYFKGIPSTCLPVCLDTFHSKVQHLDSHFYGCHFKPLFCITHSLFGYFLKTLADIIIPTAMQFIWILFLCWSPEKAVHGLWLHMESKHSILGAVNFFLFFCMRNYHFPVAGKLIYWFFFVALPL